MVAPAAREKREEEFAKLIPVVIPTFSDAMRAAYWTMDNAGRMFAEHVEAKDSRILQLLSRPENFEDSSVRYQRMEGGAVYSMEVTFNRQRLILTLRVGEDFTEFMLTDRNGKEIEYMAENKGELFHRRA
ncbi:MAG: hypothetical protein AB1657_00535 [Candidatus Micrarchaeota archaeon]